jgi:prepilin-type N-terminal cleavage/methylation domain-containing protein
MLNSRKGFTLVELIVVMAIFIVVIMITADSFNTILTQMTRITKSEESNIEGVVGLEMFRHDIQQAGYGLPFSFQSPISYPEASTAPASSYNDGTGSTASGVPRAVVAGNDLAASSTTSDGAGSYNILAGTDYLALKGSTLGLNEASQKWTYMPYSSGITGKLKPRIWPSGNLKSTSTADRVIVIKRTFSATDNVNVLVYNTADPTIYWATYDPTGFADPAYNPVLPQDLYYLYGIKNGDPLRMPFNRADYFVAKPATTANMPNFCAQDPPGTLPGNFSTGILYKGVVNHSDGKLTYVPLLDCVADMQVVFGWDVDDGMGNEGQDGILDTYSTPVATNLIDITVSPDPTDRNYKTWVKNAMADPDKLRKALKVIKVNILAQVGRRDPNYTGPASFVLGDAAADFMSKTHVMTAEQRHYHWKVYRIVARPKNLLSNQ